MYDIKYSSNKWHENFDNLIIMNGLKVNEKDKYIYYKLDNNNCIVIYLYIDMPCSYLVQTIMM